MYAFEPNAEAAALIRRNTSENGVSDLVDVNQLAVTNRTGDRLAFPRKADPSNRSVMNPQVGEDYDYVETISLADIFTRFQIERIDLLKIDCEGAEYGIVGDTPGWVWERIADVRLEYHEGQPEEMIRQLCSRGFRLDLISRTTDLVGQLRFSRKVEAPNVYNHTGLTG